MSQLTRRDLLLAAGAGLGSGLPGEAGARTASRTVAKVQLREGVPELTINGEPVPPLIYFFPTPFKEHIAGFYRSGIRIYSFGGNGHNYNMGWIGPGRFDYSLFDQAMATILDAAPECYVFPRLGVSAPRWWLQIHPEEGIVSEHEPKERPRTSMASALWRQESGEALARFIGHVRSQPYAGHVIGYQLVGGLNEWFYVGSGDRGFPDFSPAATTAFRAWLAQRYANDAGRLREAWKSGSVTFANAEAPPADLRLTADVGLLRDPARSRCVSDYYQFLSEANAGALIELCRVARKACAGESILGAFYGYLLNATGGYSGGYSAQHWGHQALSKVLSAPELDFLCAPYHYTYRGLGGAPTSQGLPECVKLHGKLWITECDNPPFTGRAGVWRMGAADYTPAQSFAILKRDFAYSFLRRTGMWWMDLYDRGGWYDHPDIHRFLRRCRVLADKSRALGARYRGEVAVVLDEETPYYVKPGMELLYPLVFLQDKLGLPRLGAPVDYYLHNDLVRANMPDYKLYIFLNTLYLTAEERAAIKDHVRRDNKVAVWMYAPGLISDDGLAAEHMRDLTGLELSYRKVGSPNHSMCHHLYLTDFQHPITRGLAEGTFFGSDSKIDPVVYCTDPQARTLGRILPSHGMPDAIGEFPGFAVRQFPEWTSVFLGVPNAPSCLLRNLARFAGCHIYNDQDAVIDANSHFLAIHTASGGMKTIRLPHRTDVYDAFSERMIARNTAEFTDELPPYGGRLYLLGDVAKIADEASRFEL